MKHIFHKYNNAYELDNKLSSHFVVLCGNTNWET
jgi:hypothetical protein